MPKPRKLHLAIEPPVAVTIRGHRVVFDGITLLRPHVMIEYDVDPPLTPETPFGQHLLIVDVTDDTNPETYPTMWHDWQWTNRGPGRTTTRLERRPHPTQESSVSWFARLSAPTPSGTDPGHPRSRR